MNFKTSLIINCLLACQAFAGYIPDLKKRYGGCMGTCGQPLHVTGEIGDWTGTSSSSTPSTTPTTASCVTEADGNCYSYWKCILSSSVVGRVKISSGHVATDASQRCSEWVPVCGNTAGGCSAAWDSSNSAKISADTYDPHGNLMYLNDADIDKIVNFLVADVNSGSSGAAYTATAGDLNGKLLPLSYWVTAEYFGDFICKSKDDKGNPYDCTVQNTFNTSTYEVDLTGPGASLQVERVNMKHGINVYDSACWQIGMAVMGAKGNRTDLMPFAENINHMLKASHYGDSNKPVVNQARALTRADGKFMYNSVAINGSIPGLGAENAFAFRMWPRTWYSTDVFAGTAYQNYIQPSNFPTDPASDAKPYMTTYYDFKPIT